MLCVCFQDSFDIKLPLVLLAYGFNLNCAREHINKMVEWENNILYSEGLMERYVTGSSIEKIEKKRKTVYGRLEFQQFTKHIY